MNSKILGILAGIGAALGIAGKAAAAPARVELPPSEKSPDDWTTGEVMAFIVVRCRYFGLAPAWGLAFAKVESSFRVRAKNPADPSYGLFAVTPMLAQDYGYVADYRNPTPFEIERLYDPHVNSEIALRHIKNLLSRYSREKAIMAYNEGPTAYDKGKRVYDYMDRIEAAFDAYSKIYPT